MVESGNSIRCIASVLQCLLLMLSYILSIAPSLTVLILFWTALTQSFLFLISCLQSKSACFYWGIWFQSLIDLLIFTILVRVNILKWLLYYFLWICILGLKLWILSWWKIGITHSKVKWKVETWLNSFFEYVFSFFNIVNFSLLISLLKLLIPKAT